MAWSIELISEPHYPKGEGVYLILHEDTRYPVLELPEKNEADAMHLLMTLELVKCRPTQAVNRGFRLVKRELSRLRE